MICKTELLYHLLNMMLNSSVPSDTTPPVEEYQYFYDNAQFMTGLICYPILCIIGLIGNGLALIVLSQRKMLTSTNVFLSALAVSDTIKLLNDLLYFLVLILGRIHPEAANNMMGYMYPVSHYIFNEAVCVTAWLTVSVAVERYIAVCHATRAKVICTVSRARFVSVIVFTSMSLLTVPSALRYTRVKVYDEQISKSIFTIELSNLGKNPRFMLPYMWIQNMLRAFVPLVTLFILNACIIHALRKQRAVKGKTASARNRITTMLISVILVFIICITPDAIMSMFFRSGYIEEKNLLVKGIREITDMLLAVNSATNFIVYCAFSKVFRHTFSSIFCRTCVSSERRDENHSLLSTHVVERRKITNEAVNMSNGTKVTLCDNKPHTYV